MKQQIDAAEDRKIQPCRHMEEYVSALSDNTLSGPARWYTRLHLLHCSRCRIALKALQALRNRLHRLGDDASENRPANLTTDRRSSLEQAMDEMDRRQD